MDGVLKRCAIKLHLESSDRMVEPEARMSGDERPPEGNKKGAVQTDSTWKSKGEKSALAELQGLGADPAKHLVISSPSA